MTLRVQLKNADDCVLLDPEVHEWLSSDPVLRQARFLQNLRKHSSGCAFFQKSWKNADGQFKIQTIYLHRLIAEQFLGHEKSPERTLVGARNGDKLDCRLENLQFRSPAEASRARERNNKLGLRGVQADRGRFRASINVDGKQQHLGMFDCPEEAARAYDRAAAENWGVAAKLNF